MSFLPFKKRSPAPVEQFARTFPAYMPRIASDFLASAAFRSSVVKGQQRESTIASFFEARLPRIYSVARGQSVDMQERFSPQLDVMVYDSSKHFPFFTGENTLLPAEALLVAVEVKSQLTRAEIEKALRAASLLKSLRPFGSEVPLTRAGGEQEDERPRYFYAVFAYASDLSPDNWIATELHRVRAVADELGLAPAVIDRVYVVNRGLLMPTDARALAEDGSGIALMNLFMHTYNFLTRENSRRAAAPYLDYAGRLTAGWLTV